MRRVVTNKLIGRGQTADERKAYQRGYNSGIRSGFGHAHKLLDLFKRYRARFGLGATSRRCDGCSHWQRGCESCHWGRCDAAFEYAIEPRMWIDTDEYVERKTLEKFHIATSDDFSCPNWMPVPEPNK